MFNVGSFEQHSQNMAIGHPNWDHHKLSPPFPFTAYPFFKK
ncbi:hypothetical protein B4110_0981 [Parageobacillus toebii]|uniref:Uncharacterized protein n=1 Tax=Parageobacillus toebii TaxID=153151 RepID=A0A150N4J1_9BACL|nr:hypothetical protein B4110_0981 [Parageobacillus toebii]